TLENVELINGQVYSFYSTAEGGAILNQGTLVLSQVLVVGNTAEGEPGYGQIAAGGGVWSNGSLTVENSSAIVTNSAQGSNQAPGTGAAGPLKRGASAYGGGICIAGGTANVTNTFFGAFSWKGNWAVGGTGGAGLLPGSAYGGAVYVASGTVT